MRLQGVGEIFLVLLPGHDRVEGAQSEGAAAENTFGSRCWNASGRKPPLFIADQYGLNRFGVLTVGAHVLIMRYQ